MPRILRAAVAALALTLMTPAVADADRWSVTDEAGDVEGWQYSPEPEPCGTDTEVDGSAETNNDIRRVSVRHTRRAMVVTTRFRDLRTDLGLTHWLYVRTDRGGWWIIVDRFQTRRGSRVFAFLAKEPELPDPDDIDDECGHVVIGLTGQPCRMAKQFDFDANRLRLWVPRACINRPRWVRVATTSHRFAESEEPADETFTSYHDAWDGGVELSEWASGYGPRVHATTGASFEPDRTSHASAGERRHVVVRDGRIFTRR